MSDTTASLRRKISSAGDLQSVVRTMKALAASSIGQYEKSVRALADYNRSVELGLSVCFRDAGSAAWTRGDTRQTDAGEMNAVVFGSDQGLVGQFNDVVADHAIEDPRSAARQTPRLGRRRARSCALDGRGPAVGRPLRRAEFGQGHHPARRPGPCGKRGTPQPGRGRRTLPLLQSPHIRSGL